MPDTSYLWSPPLVTSQQARDYFPVSQTRILRQSQKLGSALLPPADCFPQLYLPVLQDWDVSQLVWGDGERPCEAPKVNLGTKLPSDSRFLSKPRESRGVKIQKSRKEVQGFTKPRGGETSHDRWDLEVATMRLRWGWWDSMFTACLLGAQLCVKCFRETGGMRWRAIWFLSSQEWVNA